MDKQKWFKIYRIKLQWFTLTSSHSGMQPKFEIRGLHRNVQTLIIITFFNTEQMIKEYNNFCINAGDDRARGHYLDKLCLRCTLSLVFCDLLLQDGVPEDAEKNS